ncbi:hypothetical protein [Mesorhizobium dulcispinae]|uniref:hypothetical protein n=1 Tax=Mesorhizobium dulcispinae TaxID=3072316 RepID=UPI002A23F3F7|nr:hypothetical protein [Mesorhizobium sp. VK23D]MDX8522380.1 hypothetical protein [Mesorhizobium sp. VK23D]
MDEMRSVPMTHRWRINEAGLHCGYLGRNDPAAFIFTGWASKAVAFRVLRPPPLPVTAAF